MGTQSINKVKHKSSCWAILIMIAVIL